MGFEIMIGPGIFFPAVMTMKHGTSTVKGSMPDQFSNEIRSM